MKKCMAILMLAVMLGSIMSASAEDAGKVLIIYFDYSENIDTTDMDADAISSASIAEGPGVRDRSNLLVMVDLLKERTYAEIYPLHVREVYAPMFDDMAMKAQSDKNEGVQFTFAEELPDLSKVDTIYFGSAIWWYDMPQPVVNFFQRVNLAGKNLMYFSINRGSANYGNLELLEQYQPEANVFAEVSISAMQSNESATEEFTAFLDSLGW